MRKICNHCHTFKDISCFGKKLGSRDGREYNCNLCKRLLARRAYQEKKYALLDPPESEFTAKLKEDNSSLYYSLYENRGSFRKHLEEYHPKLFTKIYL